jgi:hypothetical protein
MKTPITRQDFVKIGKNLVTEDLIKEINRLHPVGLQDIVLLARRGYSLDLLGQLEGWRAALLAENAVLLSLHGTRHDQSNSSQSTSHLDELKGRTYFNLRILTLAGRVLFVELGDFNRASFYQLNALNILRKHTKQSKPNASQNPNQGHGLPLPLPHDLPLVPNLAPGGAK